MKQVIWSFLLFWLIPLTTGDTDITVICFFTSDCVLPCMSTYHDLIQWYKVGKEKAVHKFDNNKDHLENQDAAFRGRTSLFTDQLSQGNISLLLRMVRVEDEGTYFCNTSSRSEDLEKIIQLVVKAPINKVDIKITDKEIICNTSKVYPKPIIIWGEKNLTLPTNFSDETQDEQGLFSLKSIFMYKQDKQSNTNRYTLVKQTTTYTCSVSFKDMSQTYTTRLRQERVDIYSGQDANIHCPVSRGDAGNYTITLKFRESETILTSQLTNITKQWAGINVHLSQDGNVTLQTLDMYNHSGTYTCEGFTAQSSTEVVQTSVQIISDIHNNKVSELFGVAVAVMVFISLIVYCLCRINEKKKRNRKKSRKNEVNEEVEPELESLTEENPSNDTHSRNGSVHRE